jgi:hypothetical protein
MSNSIKKIIIIGSGWYGCHIASILKDKYDVLIIEKNSDIFDNSSYYNQNRLHLGFHYCRNYATRNLCQSNYDIFVKKYGSVVDYIDNNYYVISKKSVLDYQTFISIYNHEKFVFETIENNIFSNIDGEIIKVKENVINSDKAKLYFKEDLKNVKQIFNKKVIKYNKKNNKIFVETEENDVYECDLLLDCTYNQFGLSKNNYIYEYTISLLFKKIKPNVFDALTIMDGNFSSLYPRDISNNSYTLTDVEFTPLIKSQSYKDIENFKITENIITDTKKKMVNKLEQYYPNFKEYFEYDGYFLSKKTKQISSSDTRDITIEEIEKGIISVNCGKIYGIFEWEDYIKKYLVIY